MRSSDSAPDRRRILDELVNRIRADRLLLCLLRVTCAGRLRTIRYSCAMSGTDADIRPQSNLNVSSVTERVNWSAGGSRSATSIAT